MPSAKRPTATDHPVVPFDPTKETLVLDCKGLSGLPHGESANVNSFRALAMPKGKFVHAPKKAGQYVVLGAYRVPTAMQLVHFRPEVNKPPEFLLNFIDQASANGDAMVQTVQLPLEVSKGVYRKDSRTTTVEDMIGFQQIDTGKLPWSKDLAPFLKQHDQYRSLKIEKQADMLTYISSQLGARIDGLVRRAQLAIEADFEAAKNQDEAVAIQEKEEAEARLQKLAASLRELPPESYDATLSTRITCVKMLDAPAHEEQTLPRWLTTPMRDQLDQGTAAAVPTFFSSPIRRSTRLSGGAAPAPSPAEAPTEGPAVADAAAPIAPGPAPAKAARKEKARLADDSDSDDSDSDSDSDDSPKPPAKRARQAPERHVPAAAPAGASKGAKLKKAATRKGKAVKAAKPDKSCAPGVDPDAPFGRNRKGKPYKRACGSYRKNLVKEAKGTAKSSDDRKAATALEELIAANKSLGEQLRAALIEVAELKATSASAAQISKLEGQVAKSDASHAAYLQGLQKGIEMASGRAVAPASASLASGSMDRV